MDIDIDFIHILRKVECGSKEWRKCSRSRKLEFCVSLQLSNGLYYAVLSNECHHHDAVLGPVTKELGTFGAKKIKSDGPL